MVGWARTAMAARCSSEAWFEKKNFFYLSISGKLAVANCKKNFSSSLYETASYYVFSSLEVSCGRPSRDSRGRRREGGMWWVCIFSPPLVRWITFPCGCDWYADAAKYERDKERREPPSVSQKKKETLHCLSGCPLFFSTEEEAPKFPSISSPHSHSYSKVLSTPPHPPPPRHKQTGSSEGPALNSLFNFIF